MDVAYGSSSPISPLDLANCLHVGTRTGPGETTEDPRQGWNPTGEAEGEPRPSPPTRLPYPARASGGVQRELGCPWGGREQAQLLGVVFLWLWGPPEFPGDGTCVCLRC